MPNNKLKKKLAILSFNRLCNEFSILDSLRAQMPNAAYTDPVCEYGTPVSEDVASSCENIASICENSASEDVASVSEYPEVNAYTKIEEFLENQVVKRATLFVPFLNTKFTKNIIQEPEMRESLYEYLNHLHGQKYNVILYVANKTEFERNLPELSKGIKSKMLDMTMFNTQSYMQHLNKLNKQAELGIPTPTKEAIAPRTHFPTQNIDINTAIHCIVFLLFICMLRIALKPEKKNAPRLRG